MNDYYELTQAEIDEILEFNKDVPKYVCSCAIQDHKPSFCQQGPIESIRMPECGYTFENGERKGSCKRCGYCCAVPRYKGDPFGIFDPNGTKCKYLIVEVVK